MRALVCGAGIAGLTLAWHLERDGWDVELVERAAGFRDGGYLIDFYGAGLRVAERMGLRPPLLQARCPVSGVRYVDRDGRRTGGLEMSGALAEVVSLPRGVLARIVADGVRAPVRYGTTVAAAEPRGDGVAVALSDGTERHVDLLVGADGARSRVRRLVFGEEERFARYLGHHVAAYSVRDEDLGRRVGTRYQMLTVPGRMAGAYALPGGAVTLVFLRREPDPALPDDPGAALQRHYGDLGWILPEALRRRPPSDHVYYDRITQVEMDRWHRGRVVLLGDACQAVSLFAGHGASMAMAGAWVLAAELRAAAGPSGLPPAALDTALDAYERRMRPVIADVQRFGRRFVHWMAPGSRWRIAARDGVLRLAALPGARRLLLRSLTPAGHDLVPAVPEE
ncbi:FAD-dependent oxidoreductase [Sphaerisporangium sp. B11E5]|uniref:FAD-dependent oxidoreductase n=1 Tax=Sphaerisporangium sp. B11E5 TaxID=3153563 RepID=UPI00325F9357